MHLTNYTHLAPTELALLYVELTFAYSNALSRDGQGQALPLHFLLWGELCRLLRCLCYV
jgi:hypothetical protein